MKALLLVVVVACTHSQETPQQKAAPTSSGAPEGSACSVKADCASGLVCEGAGCGPMGGKCTSALRACPPETTAYCACDGKTAYATMGCPGIRYQSIGPCP